MFYCPPVPPIAIILTPRLAFVGVPKGVTAVQDGTEVTPGQLTADADSSRIRLIRPASAELALPDFSYRHVWDDQMNGSMILTLNDPAIRRTSDVFVSISEVSETVTSADPVQWPMLGSAPFTVFNIVPQNGSVVVRVRIDWDSPLSVQTTYLVINGF
jgi:hypothetical protein